MNAKAGRFLAAIGVLAVIAIGLHSCFRVTNEIGPIGADKAGRQIFLQSLQYYFGTPLGLTVTSEWSDSTFLGRLFIQEPMRTTIRFVAPDSVQSDAGAPSQFLNTPFRDFFNQFKPPPNASISLRENDSILLPEFYKRLDSLGASSVADMLAAMGFRRFEVYRGERLVTERELPTIGRANIKWAGGE